jgi:hypothetical protein
VFRHAAQNHLLDADHNSDDRDRFRTDRYAGVTGYKGRTNFFPSAEKKKSDPWTDARSAPPAAGKNKQLRIVSGEKKVSCNADEVLVSVVCSEGAPDGAGCSAGSTTTGVCMHK